MSLRMDSPIFGVETSIGSVFSNRQVFNGFGCSGENISPEIVWKNPPEGTKSFALIIHDPDAPTQVGGWTHWVVFDMPASMTGLSENAGAQESLGTYIQSMTDFGVPGFGGPCPPVGHGVHHYHITIYALGVESLGLDDTATPAQVGFHIWHAMIAQATTIVTYER